GEARRRARELVQQDRMAREEPRGPEAARGEMRGPLEDYRVLREQRVVRLASVDRFEDRQEPGGDLRAAAFLRHDRHDARQDRLDARADALRELAIARRAREVDEPGRDLASVANAHGLEVLGEPLGVGRRLRIEEPCGEARGVLGRLVRLEERAEGRLYLVAMPRDLE